MFSALLIRLEIDPSPRLALLVKIDFKQIAMKTNLTRESERMERNFYRNLFAILLIAAGLFIYSLYLTFSR